MKIVEIKFSGNSTKLPQTDQATKEKYLQHYHDLVDDFAEYFGFHSNWWYVPLSSRDHFASQIQNHFQRISELRQFFESPGDEHLTIAEGDPYIIESYVQLVMEYGWRIKISTKDKLLLLFSKLQGQISYRLSILKFLKRLFLDYSASNRRVIERFRGLDLLFIRVLHNDYQVDDEGNYFDRYFGVLPQYAFNKQMTVAITGPLLDSRRAFTKESRAVKGIPMAPSIAFLSFRNFIQLILMAFRFLLVASKAIRIKSDLIPCIAPLVQNEIRQATRKILENKVIEFGMSNLLSLSDSCSIIYTFENNSWERAVLKIVKASKGTHSTLGYLHCAVLPSHLRNYLSKKEKLYRPLPDKIVCTGPAAFNIFNSLGDYSGIKIEEGVALRNAKLDTLKLKEDKRISIENLLVLLEGLQTMPDFVEKVFSSGVLLRNYNLRIRCHPVLPLSHALFGEFRNKYKNVHYSVSSNSSLEEDIYECDAVIYKGTTAALTAAYVGLPLLRYRDSWWTSDDPFIQCQALKKEFSNGDELVDSIKYFESMTGNEIRQQRHIVRNYIKDYIKDFQEGDLDKIFLSQ